MKILAIIYYLLQWTIWIVGLITWTTTDLPIKSMPIKITILVLLAVYLVWIGIRDFITARPKTK